MKYCIQEKTKLRPNAGSKAVRDVAGILKSAGYKTLNIYAKFPHFDLWRIRLKLKKDDVIVLQWPFYRHAKHRMADLFSGKPVKLILFLHDINALRDSRKNECEEKRLLSLAETIIVHTDAMKRYLTNSGIDPQKVLVLSSFDYLTDEAVPHREQSDTLVFAGNLTKSTFLKQIPDDCFGMQFNCYGRRFDGNILNHLAYKGSFVPENVSSIEGSWGLVWDGDSIDGCRGMYGEYLKYNSPHKVSLYIVAGLPVIIWKHAALAKYVVENDLGVVIESLRELPDVLHAISREQYEKMLVAVEREASTLKAGKHLMSLLNEQEGSRV